MSNIEENYKISIKALQEIVDTSKISMHGYTLKNIAEKALLKIKNNFSGEN